MLTNTLLFIGGLGGSEILLLSLLVAIPGIVWLWALIDLLTSDFGQGTTKLVWAVVIIFLPFLGALLYLFIGRGQKLKRANHQ